MIEDADSIAALYRASTAGDEPDAAFVAQLLAALDPAEEVRFTCGRPDNAEKGGSQTLDLQPSQGGFVEFSLHEAGNYAMVTHKFANVGKGALGLFVAGTAADSTMAGH